ncbi:MAG: hypothetical protein Q9216_001087 [Gyalolechia sp. 2 TL-2023]
MSMADRMPAQNDRRIISQPPIQSSQLQDQPQRSQRVTRSQSRDLSDGDVERRNIYARKAKPTAATVRDRSATAGAQRKGKLTVHNGAKALQDLPEIEENSQIDHSKPPQSRNTTVKQSLDSTRRQSGRFPRSPDGASTFSGTTARISGSGEELLGGSTEEMVDVLEDLFDVSNKVLGLLVPSKISQASVQGVKERLLDLKSKETRQLQRYTPYFQAQRVVYGDDRLINVPAVVRTVLDISRAEKVPPGPWRIDPILYRANLASLAISLMTQNREGEAHLWHELNKLFPRPFLQRLVANNSLADLTDSSTLLLETFQIGVDIRTRDFIESAKRLVNEEGFDPDALLEQVFYKDNNTLNGWGADGLKFDDINHNREFRSFVIARLDQLRDTFSQTEAPFIDLEGLEEMFPHARVLTTLFQWSQLRLQEIELQLQKLGGANGIVQAIQTVRSTSGAGGLIPLRTMQVNMSLGENSLGATPNHQQAPSPEQVNISKATKQLKRSQDFATLTTRLTSQVPSGTPPTWQPPVTEEEGHFATAKLDLGSQVNQIIETRQILEAESNKENLPLQEPSQILDSQPSPQGRAQLKRRRFLDHQENAERMNWDTQESNPVSTRHSQQPRFNDTRAEKHGEEDDSTSEDQYQQDTRQVPQPQRVGLAKRNPQRGATPRLSPKRARSSQNRQEATESGGVEESLHAHSKNNDPIPSQVERYALVNERAKQQTAVRPKKPQVRTPWSEEETERFLELVEEHGLSWSRLKEMDKLYADGPRLARRDQVALKDKARNIKLDWLK